MPGMMRGSWMVVLMAAACGGGGNSTGHLPDAPPAPDAAIDGNTDSPVTVTVTSGGAPSPGVHVYFVAADGTLVKTADTGADGTASAVMAAGGSVTVLDPFAVQGARAVGNNTLVSFMAVKPGDHLRLSNSERASVSLALTAPSATDATGHNVFTTCGRGTISAGAGGGPTASGTVELEGCHGATDIAIVASKVDPTTKVSTPISGLFHAGVSLTGGPVNLDDSYGALTDVSVMYTHAPAGTSPRVFHTPLVAHGRLGPFDVNVSGADGTLAGTVQEPAGIAASSAITATFELPSGEQPSGEYKVIDWGALAMPYALDLSGVLVRAVADPPSYDFASGAVVWTEAAGGAAPDSMTTLIEATRSAQSREWIWFFVAPYTGTRLAVPRLPADVADWTPVAGDTAFIDHVSLLKMTGGYDALRARDVDFSDNNDLSLITGASGRIALFTATGAAISETRRVGASASDRRVLRRAAR
jgi:hypothetical protein